MNRVIIRSVKEVDARLAYAKSVILRGLEGGPVVLEIKRETRTLEQNAKLWPMLTDVSRQVNWYGRNLSEQNWKDIFTAALKGSDTVPGIDGGFVVLGLHTSSLNKKAFSNLIELIYAFGAEKGVEWSEKSKATYDNYGHEYEHDN